ILYKFTSRSRIGFNIKLPTSFTVREEYASDGSSLFDVPDDSGWSSYSYRIAGKTEYDVTTPFVFSAGLSLAGEDVMLAADIEYTDWTQMKFSNADPYLEQYNSDIKEIFQPTVNLHGGLEFSVPETSLRLRGGVAYIPSPYKNDPTSFNQKFVTGGLGLLLADVIMFDVGFSHGFWETSHVNYQHDDISGNPLSETKEKITTNNLMTTLSYRF
ncbi:MAG: outer membrane protein transport protein, partial [Ignavibacteriales bacterium]|nr:outer membrane protein transport protein [Ignavibacteriales bacterium]